MYKTIILTMTLIGAAMGVLSALTGEGGVMVVMGLIGAAFGCPIGAGLCALIRVFIKPKNFAEHDSRGSYHSDVMEFDPFEQMKMAQEWLDERERARIAEELDATSKAITGW